MVVLTPEELVSWMILLAHEIATSEGSFQDYCSDMSQIKPNGPNRIKREKGKLF